MELSKATVNRFSVFLTMPRPLRGSVSLRGDWQGVLTALGVPQAGPGEGDEDSETLTSVGRYDLRPTAGASRIREK